MTAAGQQLFNAISEPALQAAAEICSWTQGEQIKFLQIQTEYQKGLKERRSTVETPGPLPALAAKTVDPAASAPADWYTMSPRTAGAPSKTQARTRPFMFAPDAKLEAGRCSNCTRLTLGKIKNAF